MSSAIKLVFFITLIVSTIALPSPSADIGTRVIGGVGARRTEFPHICSIQSFLPIIGATHIGGASIVTNRYVVTAASLIDPPPLPIIGRREVVCGRLNLALPNEVTEQRVQFGTIFLHPDYLRTSLSPNDIAMIQLVSQLFFNDWVQPINLPTQSAVAPSGIHSLIGWAGTDESWLGQNLGTLQLSRVAILPQATCAALITTSNNVTNTHFCTGPLTGGLSPCNEDLGSSLLSRNATNAHFLAGIVSLPQGCGASGRPGSYTMVSMFANWINQIILI
ncbi:Trypsin-1 [Pseudolycoriella hygida]|uniref:Trypsin-1 n=1 Tax=Pseudolycoriella hygida TaxID=35572 RepID=A0A9Q0S8A0_9DIPT|nr:Trypsin-1 [Pseudolycoriella hygida]